LDTIADDILTSSKGQDILLYSNQRTEKSFFSKAMHEKFVQTRIKNNTKIKVLVVDNKEGRELKKSDKGLLRETKILPKNISFNSEIYIYDGKIAMIDIKDEVIGVIIENEELFRVHRQMFEVVWKTSL
jgi:ribosomal protein S19